MDINIIVAVSKNGVIGKNNKLLWKLKDDMKFFRTMTTDCTVIMGRKTYESIGRPLPKRTNIIITRQKNYVADNCIVVNSLEEAIKKAYRNKKMFIIGGGEIYKQASVLINTAYITHVDIEIDGDVYLEDFIKGWQTEEVGKFKKNENNEFDFKIIKYTR